MVERGGEEQERAGAPQQKSGQRALRGGCCVWEQRGNDLKGSTKRGISSRKEDKADTVHPGNGWAD